MIDFAEHSETGDIYLDDTQDFAVASEAEETAQAVNCQLNIQKGEYHLDKNWGTDYLGQVFKKTSTKAGAEAELRRSAKQVAGVRNVIRMEIEEDDQPTIAAANAEIDTIYSRLDFGVSIST